MTPIICILLAYLIGSLSTAIILSKLLKFPDPRTTGSGNAGATNVLRSVGKHQALAVLIGDLLKGMLAVWIGRMLGLHDFWLGFVAFAAVVGHVFPLYFKFKGGKGVATAIGAIFALSFVVGVIALVIWMGIAVVLRYSSFASLAAIAATPILLLLFSSAAYLVPSILLALLIIWKHKDNIQRLRIGAESKIQF